MASRILEYFSLSVEIDPLNLLGGFGILWCSPGILLPELKSLPGPPFKLCQNEGDNFPLEDSASHALDDLET